MADKLDWDTMHKFGTPIVEQTGKNVYLYQGKYWETHWVSREEAEDTGCAWSEPRAVTQDWVYKRFGVKM